jgi:hypothetical protein
VRLVRHVVAAVVCAGLLGACYGSDSNLTESGKGRPVPTIDFPASVAPGSTHTAVLEITNPGPGDIGRLLVTFTLVGGATQTAGVGNPIVGLGTKGANPSIAGIEPEPLEVSEDGVGFQFEGLAEDQSTTIEFELIVPTTLGVAANAVTVSDAHELDRARGVVLRTTVER